MAWLLIFQDMSPDSGSPISHLAIPKRTSLFLLGPTRIEAFEVGEKALIRDSGKSKKWGPLRKIIQATPSQELKTKCEVSEKN